MDTSFSQDGTAISEQLNAWRIYNYIGSATTTMNAAEVIYAPAADPDQAWFWTQDWQEGERQADEDIANGRVTRYNTDEEFLESLD